MIKKILNSFKHPELALMYCSRRGWLRWMSDEKYIKKIYSLRFGKKLDLENPKTFNEKLQWLKLNNRNPEYTKLVDKYAVREYISQTIGEEYLVPILGVWERFDDIEFDKLPDKFVLKCTHDSGSVIVCKDKRALNVKKAKKKLSRCLKNNGYNFGREWPYKNVKPQIMAEVYLEDKNSSELKDYKVMCFNGVPKLIQIHSGRFGHHTQDFYDSDWNKQNFSQGSPCSDCVMEKPTFLEKMLELTMILAKDMPHVRIDWYYANEQLYFGEITLFDGSGFCVFESEEWDMKIGEWINLPQVYEVTK